ncbi:MAG: class I SAM-dependent methyltransferase [Candidatus Micrarchaeia archaeon]
MPRGNLKKKGFLRLLSHGAGILRVEGPVVFSRRLLRCLFDWNSFVSSDASFFLFPYVFLRLKTIRKDLPLDGLFDAVYNGFATLLRPSQIKEEFLGLLKLAGKARPKVIVEIGTNRGGTLFLLSRMAPDDATLISIDLPGGKYGGGYPKWKVPIFRSFARKKQRIMLIEGNSHEKGTLERLRGMLCGREIDFLFIDGDHTYGGVKKDFEIYSPLVRKGGMVAFHDIVAHPPAAGCNVNRFWNEAKRRYAHEEIVEDWKQMEYGIGVLRMPGNQRLARRGGGVGR